MNSMEIEQSVCSDGGSSTADTARAGSKKPEPSLDDLVEENFDTLDPGCPQTKKFKRINPKKRCIHCEWTQAGTRQVFVNHILDLASTIRTKVCREVPEEIKAQFKKAMLSNTEVLSVTQSAPVLEDVIPIISDETLFQMVDFSAEFFQPKVEWPIFYVR